MPESLLLERQKETLSHGNPAISSIPCMPQAALGGKVPILLPQMSGSGWTSIMSTRLQQSEEGHNPDHQERDNREGIAREGVTFLLSASQIHPLLEQLIEYRRWAIQAVALLRDIAGSLEDEQDTHFFTTDKELIAMDGHCLGSQTPQLVTPQTADTII
ncbi:hypothetical protein NDU88_005645 [Pleurodeles waltl]|uniref:Uncharacterized protein n=1 Tax=Pleurodeles waltl TaxID=8319 RepID=A0AAV7WDY9_PLEWA|nr:hypothetical protein NDU88_005645 [Pleurodeles waltl]